MTEEEKVTSVNSVTIFSIKSLTKEIQEEGSEKGVTKVTNNLPPPYPTHSCLACGCGDYWLRGASEWGKAEWLCSCCHLKPSSS